MLPDNEIVHSDVADQKARAVLREGFLTTLRELIGKSCSMLTYEQSTLKAKFTAWKPDGSDIFVTDLETPAGIKIPSAFLRSRDILAINFEEPIE